LARLEQLELGAPGDHFLSEADEALDDIAKSQCFWPAAANREHVRRKAGLGRRVPPQLIEDDLWRGVALQVDDDADAFAVRLVADVADALDTLVLSGFSNLLDEAGLADLIGDFGEYDRAPLAS